MADFPDIPSLKASKFVYSDLDLKKATINRRDFLKVSTAAGGGLLIALLIPKTALSLSPVEALFNPLLKISEDNTVRIILSKVEMGQGMWTTLPMLIAEELDCERMLVGGDAEVVEGAFVTVLDARAADHLRAHEAGTEPPALSPECLHADTRHGRQHEAGGDLHIPDLPAFAKVDLHVSIVDTDAAPDVCARLTRQLSCSSGVARGAARLRFWRRAGRLCS
jgi:CO/xanthine dehydrogenase Mo-binding subunit